MPENISHYRILSKLGSGGMGEVYLAEDTNLGRTVAIKLLPVEVAADPERLRRFVQEAKAASVLKHPNVASIYELGESENIRFIAMEHVEGETLEAKLKGNPLEVNRLLEVAIQTIDALDEAHSRGVVHRDLKPANIMITPRGQAKVLDFGLAKFLQPSDPQSEASKLATKSGTEPGLVMGTVQYMSPEQALGRVVDHRSDLFSLGVVLYQMATGRLPFAGDSQTETINKIINSVPDALARLNYAVPPELDHIVRKCLEKDPDNRYQSAHDLLIDLRNLKRDTESGSLSARSATTVPAAARSARSWKLPAIAAIAVLVVVAAFLFQQRKQESASGKTVTATSEKRKMLAVLPFENLGSAEDQYFATGMTDEITSRLSTVKDLGVISRTSSMQYNKTNKSIKQIGQELGVDYVLEGSIRWSRSGGSSKVRVTPQLVRVADDTQVWSDNFDRVLDDVFNVQSEIASALIAQLGINLLQTQQENLTAQPTSNLEAYQAYLKGNENMFLASYDQKTFRDAIEQYTRATQLDPEFAHAYSYIARSHLHIFHEGYDPTPQRLALAKEAADTAIRLKPNLPEALVAMGYYYYHGFSYYEKALQYFGAAAAAAPNNIEPISGIAYIERRQGKFEESIRHLKKVLELDPRNPQMPGELASCLMRLRRYAEADNFIDRSLALAPEQVYGYGMKSAIAILWKGDLKQARMILEKMPDREPAFSQFYWTNQETMERNYTAALERLDRTPVELFQEEGIFVPKTLAQARVYSFSKQEAIARTYYEKARSFLEEKALERPKSPAVHSSLGIAYAGLGRKEDAIREGKLAVELLPVSRDALIGDGYLQVLAEIYAMVGEYDQAFDQMDHLLSIPSWFSVNQLKLDPRWDPLRSHPRYTTVLAKYSS
ncbi:protein kinase [bacterium]|nr:protein kinase [bacterium]